VGQSVGGFEGAEDAFAASEELEGAQRIPVAAADIFGAAAVLEVGVLGADGRIVEAGGDGPGVVDLPVRVLEDVGLSSTNSAKAPMAFEPPPTQAITASGSRPSSSRIWPRASLPMTRWNSRTISGKGWGPATVPSR
jgi:hypothetical protein